MRKTPLRKRGKSDRKKLEDKLWELCKKIIRTKYTPVCYTCNRKELEGMNWQTGHGKPKGALPLLFKYDLRNLRPQCFNCNMNLGGMSDIFIAKLEKEKEGKEFLKDSCVKVEGRWEIKHQEPMGSMQAQIFINSKIDEYNNILKHE